MNTFNDQDMMEQFFQLAKKLRKYYFFQTREDGHGKHLGQGRILSLLKLKPKTTQKELSYLLDMRPQSMGELLSKLEKKGYITREPSEDDRRVMSIELTEAGLEMANENEKQVSKYTVFDVLTDEEKTLYSEMNQKLIDALDQDLPQDEEEFVKLIKKLRNHRGGHGRGSRGFGPGGDPRGFRPGRGFGRDPRSFSHERDFRGFGPGQGFQGFEGGRDFHEHEADPRHFNLDRNNSANNSSKNEDAEK